MNEKCIAPEKIEEGDLLAYVAGDASAEVVAHVAACAYCRAEAAALRETSGLLSAAAFRQECPDIDLLLQYDAGLLPRTEARPIQAHLAECVHCQAEAAQLTAVPAAVGADNSWGSLLREGGRRLLEAIRQPVPKAATLVRGRNLQQVYLIEDYKFVVDINDMHGLGQRWEIEGQVTLASDPLVFCRGHVTLLRGDKVVAEDELDEFGYFDMENVKTGHYTLQFELAEVTVQIKDVKTE